MMQAHCTIGQITPRQAGQVMMTHSNRYREKPFVRICNKRRVTRWILRWNSRQLMQCRRDGSS